MSQTDNRIALSPAGLRCVAIFLAIAGVVLGSAAATLARSLPEQIAAFLVMLNVGNAVAIGLAVVSLCEHAACAKQATKNVTRPSFETGVAEELKALAEQD